MDNTNTPSIEGLAERIKKARERASEAKKAVEFEELSSKEKLRSDEDTRHSLTFLFILGFFLLLGLSAIYVAIYNALAVDWAIKLNAAGLLEQSKNVPFLELDKVLSLIVSALGTSLGFIIGYYFKSKEK
ncbi:hypothetical protein V461_21725 [Pantoea ananatis BRT98]|uniref:hypothetical protein n=1 Tax=Pantoea ananas TaxID=553 RepID=UPI001EE524D5|nr:hypothetical protein [Pantoea ananatis]PKC39247.1 hypothetical protein V461_21725 [Pantoea ananatis BRT98]